jgi:hypothetical protein
MRKADRPGLTFDTTAVLATDLILTCGTALHGAAIALAYIDALRVFALSGGSSQVREAHLLLQPKEIDNRRALPDGHCHNCFYDTSFSKS